MYQSYLNLSSNQIVTNKAYLRNTSSIVVADNPKLPTPNFGPFCSSSANNPSNFADSSVGRRTESSAPTSSSTSADWMCVFMTSIKLTTSQLGSFTITK